MPKKDRLDTLADLLHALNGSRDNEILQGLLSARIQQSLATTPLQLKKTGEGEWVLAIK